MSGISGVGPGRALWRIVLSAVFAIAAASEAGAAADFIGVRKVDGVWWFISPENKPFFSVGVNCAGGCLGYDQEPPMAPKRREWIVSSLRKWGFTTLGNWSAPGLWDSDLFVEAQFSLDVDQKGEDVFRPDLLDGWRAEHITWMTGVFAGKRNFLGYFLDNERFWNPDAIFAYYAKLPERSPGGAAFRKFLAGRGKEGREVLRSGGAAKAPEGLKKAWAGQVMKEYYGKIASLVRRKDPNHLILGLRMAYDIEIIKAVGPVFDVISDNAYNRYGTTKAEYAEWNAVSGRPIMVTEWSFSGYPTPGLPSLQFIDVYSQEERAFGYRKFMLDAARAPYMVGMDWFLWSDYERQKPAEEGGYPPDENMGLVSNDEKIEYRTLTKECARTNAELAAVHAGSAGYRYAPIVQGKASVSRGAAAAIDGSLDDWPVESALAPNNWQALHDDSHPATEFRLMWDSETLFLGGRIMDSRMDFFNKDSVWWADGLTIVLWTKTPDGPDGAMVTICPVGDGPGKDGPYAAQWYGAGAPDFLAHQKEIAVAKKRVPGGFTIEAAIPWRLLLSRTKPVPGSILGTQVYYQDVSGVVMPSWDGELVLSDRPPARD